MHIPGFNYVFVRDYYPEKTSSTEIQRHTEDFWKKVFWNDETKINLYQGDGKCTSSSVKHGGGGVMAWACRAATVTGAYLH